MPRTRKLALVRCWRWWLGPARALRCQGLCYLPGLLRQRRSPQLFLSPCLRQVTMLSQGTKSSYSQGKIINMMSSDVDRLRCGLGRSNPFQ